MIKTLVRKLRTFAHKDIYQLQEKLMKEMEEQRREIQETGEQEKTVLEEYKSQLEQIREESGEKST